MKTKAANTKGSKETVSRKPKKPDRKPNHYGKQKVEDKKQRKPIQKSRFTNIEELQSPSALELFGSLIFTVAKDTFDVHISDNTGDYELRVSNETMKEFKLKVLLGVDQRSKPKFTILLGDCQCYPELPEGPLVMDGRMNMEDECLNGYTAEENVVVATQGCLSGVDGNEQCTEALPGAVFTGVGNEDGRGDPTNVLKKELNDDSFGQQTESGEGNGSDDGRAVQSKKSSRKFEKTPTRERKNDALNIRVKPSRLQDCASTYMNNLEGFINFLMNDELCCSALKKTRALPNVTKAARRIVGGRNTIKYSDGREFVITFEERDAADNVKRVVSEVKNDSSECPPNSVKSESETSLTTLKELLSTSDDKTGRKLEEELRAREELMEADEFVESAKQELIEWKSKCEEAADVRITSSDKACKEAKDDVNNAVSDVLNALQKDDVYEDATSNSSHLAQADSLEHFFLELDEYEEMTVREESKEVVKRENSDGMTWVVNDGKPNAPSETGDGLHFDQRYTPPVPLNMTSTADIELMWMSFVKQFRSGGETVETPNPREGLLQKSDLRVGQFSRFSDIRRTTSSVWSSTKVSDSSRRKIDSVYPGQHCFPYFVEANLLQRVNSVLSSFKVRTSRLSQSERESPLSERPRLDSDAPHPKYHFPALSPVKLNSERDRRGNCPLHRNPNTLPQERFPNRRNRIFFNPNVSAGDWH